MANKNRSSKKQSKATAADILATQNAFAVYLMSDTFCAPNILTRSHQLQLGDVAAATGLQIEELVRKAVSTFLAVEAPVLMMHC